MHVGHLMRSISVGVALVVLTAFAADAVAQSSNPRLKTRHTKYKVRIDSAPQKAAIYLDDKKYGIVGYTPWSGRLPKGNWKVIYELKGYEPKEKTIYVRRTRATQEFFEPLVKKVQPGVLDVRADADRNAFGAKVWLDGQLQGQIPIILKVADGRHLLEIKKTDYEDFSQWVQVKEGDRINVNPMLKAIAKEKWGEILVESDVPDASVYLDGNLHPDKTPTLIRKVLVGPHVIEIRKDPAMPWKQTLNVEEGKTFKVRAELKATIGGPGGSVRVLSNVEGASVFLDGNDLGPAPMDIKDVKPGEHVIEVKAAGYLVSEKRITVGAGSAAVLKFELQPEKAATTTGTLKVVSPVPEAVVYVDGENVGSVPQTREVTSGDHFVVVTKKGYQKFEKKIRIEAGQTISVTAELKAVGGIRILSTPSGADVLMDGEIIGKTPMVKDDINVGDHVIGIQYTDYYSAEKTVAVKGGELLVVSEKLEKIDTGPTIAELAREQKGLTSFGARVLPRGRTTIDMAMGYPYYFDLRFNVGAGKLAGKNFDAGAFFRSFLSRSELGITGRLNLADSDPFSAGIFATLGGGSNFFDDSGRNAFLLDTGLAASLSGLGSVTITGRAYLNIWSDRHCAAFKDGEFEGKPIDVCRDYQEDTLSTEDRERVDELLDGTNPFKRDNGMRMMVSAIVEIALRQRWNIWAMFEGAPFQAERAAYVDFFASPLLKDDIGTYFRLGTTYKF